MDIITFIFVVLLYVCVPFGIGYVLGHLLEKGR